MKEYKKIIDQSYELQDEEILFFRENGFIKLKNILPAKVLDYYGQIITQKVIELNTMHLPMDERDTYQKAFLQVMNIWRENDTVKEFVIGKRLAQIATELLGTKGVRLYHDQALYKEPAGGITPWHADQYYWPLQSEKTITVWIPLQKTPLEMGPVAFAAGSHKFSVGRDLAISDESEIILQKAFKEMNFDHRIEPFDLGDVSFHYGWTFHHAESNNTNIPRRVMTIIYMDNQMRLKEPVNDNQKNDWESWCPGAIIGEVIDTEINPILYHC